MNQGKTGFGLGGLLPRPQIPEVMQKIIAGDHTALLQSMERSLRLLAEKYVEPAILQPQQVKVTASASDFTRKFDLSTQSHNALALNVVTGTMNVFIGDYSGTAQTAQPHLQIVAGSTVQLFLPTGGRVYTVINPSAVVDLVACIIPMAV